MRKGLLEPISPFAETIELEWGSVQIGLYANSSSSLIVCTPLFIGAMKMPMSLCVTENNFLA